MISFVLVRRNETICCLIGFGIGVGCCILYRLISNLFSASSNGTSSSSAVQREASVTMKSSDRISPASESQHRSEGDEMTWSEISSSLSAVNLLHDSYHSNSLTADSGVECSELPARYHQRYADLTDNDDDNETLLRKYDSDTALHHDRRKKTSPCQSIVLLSFLETATESHVMSYISTEKGLERALEQTTRFYTDLEHIASELGTLTKRYSQSQTSLSKYSHRSIDALDWDWHEEIHSPKGSHRKQQSLSSSSTRSSAKNKLRRRLNVSINQTEYNESDHDRRVLDCTTSPLRRRHSSVYFGSTDNSSDDEDNVADETLQMT
jgi:hypothetical protein